MRKTSSVVTRVAAAASAVLLLAAALPADAQVRLAFDKRPTLKVRDMLEVDVRLKTQADFRHFPQDPASQEDVFDLHRARLGVEGTFLKRFDYQAEAELSDRTQPWRDVYLDARALKGLDVRGGQFKIPFGLDQQTGSMDLDFNYRSLAGTYLAPGRDLGVMAHGHVLKDAVRYQAGVFEHGGDNVRESERTDSQANRTVAGRLVFKPWNGSSNRALKSIEGGLAFTDGRLPKGLNSLRGKTVPGDAFFEKVYVMGHRRRIGGELQWRPSSVAVQAEFMRARDDRLNQGIDNETLPDLIAQGWYVSSTWLVTGERKKDSIDSAHRLGAVELAGRVEQLRISSDGAAPGAFESPRTAWIAPRADEVWTAGVNWYLNDYVKLQANLIRERRMLNGQAIAGQDDLWSRTLRLQFGF